MDFREIFNELHDDFIILLCAIAAMYLVLSAIGNANDHHMTQATIWICTAIVLDKLGK